MKIQRMEHTVGLFINNQYSIWVENLWPDLIRYLFRRQDWSMFSLVDFTHAAFKSIDTWHVTTALLGFRLIIKRDEDFTLDKGKAT